MNILENDLLQQANNSEKDYSFKLDYENKTMYFTGYLIYYKPADRATCKIGLTNYTLNSTLKEEKTLNPLPT